MGWLRLEGRGRFVVTGRRCSTLRRANLFFAYCVLTLITLAGCPQPSTVTDGAPAQHDNLGPADLAVPELSIMDAVNRDAETCGNGVIDKGEHCDGNQLGGKLCRSLNSGFNGGTLACKDCSFDPSGCTCTHPAVAKSCKAGWCNVPAGCFMMGTPPSQTCAGAFKNETYRRVALSMAFEMAATEVTQGQYASLMGYNPANHDSCGADCPVELMSWHSSAAYCNALSKKVGLTPCYIDKGSGKLCTLIGSDSCQVAGKGEICILGKCARYEVSSTYDGTTKKIYRCPGYRLPTEAEWEYAYRAGTTTETYAGELTSCFGYDVVADHIGWYYYNAGIITWPHTRITYKVGKKTPNAWGLYDMAGNVEEWCHDGYSSKPSSFAGNDPVNTGQYTQRVLRGGSADKHAASLRASARTGAAAGSFNHLWGFRCVRTIKP